MEIQEAILLGLSIAALVFAIMSIGFGVAFFIVQIRQAKGMMKENSDFTMRMNTILSEIRITQDVTGKQVKDQFGYEIDFQKRGAERYHWTPPKTSWRERIVAVGCIVILLAAVGLVGIGLDAVLNWIF